MAQAIACDLCGQEQAVMLETRVETGEVIAVGAACLIPFYTGSINGIVGMLTDEDAAQFAPAFTELAKMFVRDVPGAEGAAVTAPDPRPRRRRAKRPEHTQDEADADGQAGAHAEVDAEAERIDKVLDDLGFPASPGRDAEVDA